MSDMACPNCGAELDLATVFSGSADHAALARLAAVSVPLGARVLQYVQLFKPARQNLTLRKKVRLLLQLLPDLERQAITWKGREWAAPLPAWAQALDQMLAMRDAGKLKLPMTQHGYLYAILAGLADKQEAAAETAQEARKRGARPAGARGAAPAVHQVLGGAPGPTPAPAGTSPTVRAMRQQIADAAQRRGTRFTNPTGEDHE